MRPPDRSVRAKAKDLKMPARYAFTLRPRDGRRPQPYEHVRGLRAWVYRCIRTAAPEVELNTRVKPFTVSPLWPSDEHCVVVVTTLNDEFSRLLVEGAAALKSLEQVLRLGYQEFDWETPGEAGIQESFERLWSEPWNGKSFSFELLSPTATHVRTVSVPFRKANPVPSPEWFFNCWRERWNAYAPPDLKFDEQPLRDMVEGFVALSFLQGETRLLRFREKERARVFIGFVGRVEFRVLHPECVTPVDFQRLAALARFSNYAGTGLEVVRGMGQTRHVTR